MRALLIDLDGVVYQGEQLVPGAAGVLAWVQERQIRHLFVTNTTSRSRRALAERLASFGLTVPVDTLWTPAVAARQWLVENTSGPIALFVSDAAREDFESLPWLDASAETGAASVVIGDLANEWSYERLNRAFRLLMQEPQPAFIALGTTRYWLAADGLRLDAGPFVSALEFAVNRSATVIGKPSQLFFAQALERLDCDATQAVMIGDDIVSDVGAAQRLGVRGVLVRTGKFRPHDLEGGVTPDAVLASIVDLPEWWRKQVT
ncbi:MAG: TIGR01458 family HAD-type hydrolase [Steroidobacteraceae bacterium]